MIIFYSLFHSRMLTHIFFYVLFSGVFYSDCVNKYCNSNLCMNKQHTLCKFPTPGPAAHCLDYELTIKSDKDKQLILDKINARRDKVASGDIRSLPAAEDMFKMEWNEELAESAQRWADQCVSNKAVGEVEDDCRDIETMRVGQNIATVYGEAPGLTPTALVDVWYLQLLNVNASVLSRYRSSSESGPSSYNQFTQLVWAASYQVGCGGVKFKEYFKDSEEKKDRVVYRLVCNFAPSGNQLNQPVYTAGQPGKCDYGTSDTYKKLCNSQPINLHGNDNAELDDSESDEAEFTTDIINVDETSVINNQTTNLTTDDPNLYGDDNMTFDYFSHLFELTKEHFSSSTTPGVSKCKNELAVDEIVKIVKNKLSDDPALKAILATTVSTSSGNIIKDEKVAEFLNKIYKKATSPTKPEAISTDYVNSTLLVNLVEAVMFRHTDGINDQVTQEILGPFVNPIKIQAVSAVKSSYDFTGHYFFPEYDGEDTTKIFRETDYDISYKPSESDVVMEIEEIRKSRPTRDFIEEILETEPIIETTTRMKPLSPDDMRLQTSGYSNMRNFLKDIAEKSESLNDMSIKKVPNISKRKKRRNKNVKTHKTFGLDYDISMMSRFYERRPNGKHISFHKKQSPLKHSSQAEKFILEYNNIFSQSKCLTSIPLGSMLILPVVNHLCYQR
ncbi:uncharacterized protein LOC134743622 isoform X1 [Cydia strobilella]|uniref:uncharacterized protein LOC134743622 isoform X1 n=1 Tax=Cydia strobilella TaxID=1100964 RepID=UPI003006138A